MVGVIREITSGRIGGELVAAGTVQRFLGIPYADPTGGSARFRAPQPVAAWTGVRDCTKFGPAAPQPASDQVFGPSPRAQAMAALIDAGGHGERQGEDCLVLNVWAPSDEPARPRPVMVWFHGGAFTIGSAAPALYDGTVLANRHDVVVVTVNHRLGALGYLYVGDVLGGDYAVSGNVGQLDLIAALGWVQHNAAVFGGDPGCVTIFGESGGGQKVSVLMAMPDAEGLFHRAIVQSGPCVQTVSSGSAARTTRALMDDLGLGADEAKRLLDVPADVLMASQLRVLGGPLGGVLTGGRVLQPVVDGISLPSQPWDPEAPGVSASVPLLIGTTKDEMSLFAYPDDALDDVDDTGVAPVFEQFHPGRGEVVHAAYRAARPDDSPRQHLVAVMTDRFRIGSIRMAERRVRQQGAPVWMYRFDFETDVLEGALGAPHAIDIAYVFGDADSTPLTGSGPGRHALAEVVSASWATFARHGDPCTPDLADWAPYNLERRPTMLLHHTCTVVDDPDPDQRRAWETP